MHDSCKLYLNDTRTEQVDKSRKPGTHSALKIRDFKSSKSFEGFITRVLYSSLKLHFSISSHYCKTIGTMKNIKVVEMTETVNIMFSHNTATIHTTLLPSAQHS